jgi:hypothetical protein
MVIPALAAIGSRGFSLTGAAIPQELRSILAMPRRD